MHDAPSETGVFDMYFWLHCCNARRVQDPFAGTAFKGLTKNTSLAGIEVLPYDFNRFVMSFGIPSIDAFNAKVGVSPTAAGQPLGNIGKTPSFTAGVYNRSLDNPDPYPDTSEFFRTRSKSQHIIDAVFEKFGLDALVYPHASSLLPALASTDRINATTVSQINVAGTPLVTVPSVPPPDMPASPFCLAFLGPVRACCSVTCCNSRRCQCSSDRVT